MTNRHGGARRLNTNYDIAGRDPPCSPPDLTDDDRTQMHPNPPCLP